jgi:tetratricopeptide (TPR) repeat protein
MSRFSVRSLFAELRRRRVFNTALLYIIGAWGTLQVSELALPALDIPDRAIRYVWLAAFALLPLVMALGWRYDISTGGVKRTAPAGAPEDADTSLKKPDRWLIGLLGVVAAGVLSLTGYRIAIEEPLPEILLEPTDNRIAVLPFRACPESAVTADIAHSLASEVISHLAGRDFVDVVGGNSSFWLAEQDLLPAEIADQLSVNYLLSGELCGSSGELELAAELAEASGGIRMRERFAERANAFGQVEELLSSQVAARVAAEFGDVLPAASDKATNQEALQEFRFGQEWRRQGQRDKARAAFERALKLQPDYAQAVYALAQIEHTSVMSDRKQEHFERARPLLERGLDMAQRQLRLDPRSAQAHYTIGTILADLAETDWELDWRGMGNDSERDPRGTLAEAEQHLRQAISADPTLLPAYLKLADTVAWDRPQERLDVLERAAEVEPLSVGLAHRQAETLLNLGRYPQAMEALQRIHEPLRIPGALWHHRYNIPWETGRNDDAFRTLVQALQHFPPGALRNGQLAMDMASFAAVLAQLGLQDAADLWWKETIDALPSGDRVSDMLRSWYLSASGRYEENAAEWAKRLAGKTEAELLQADRALAAHYVTYLVNAGNTELAIRLLEKMSVYDNAKDELWLAYLYRENGQEAAAEQALASVIDKLEDRRSAGYRSGYVLYSLAQAYALQGRSDDAISALSQAYDYHAFPTFRGTVAPWFRPFESLEDDPRYQNLQERLALDLQRQARSIERMLEELDLDRLFASIRPPAESEQTGSE